MIVVACNTGCDRTFSCALNRSFQRLPLFWLRFRC